VDVLLWLVPTGVATVLAMLWAAWAGHRLRVGAADERRRSFADDAAARARLGKALGKPLPRRAGTVADQRVPSATGVAVRRSGSSAPADGRVRSTR